MLKSGERGQAVVETALFMPIILLCLFATFLAVTQGAMIERLQLALRYAGIITENINPYLKSSLYASYATLDGADPFPNPCVGVSANSQMLTANRKTFWQPVAGSVTSSCWYQLSTAQAGTNNQYMYNFSNAFLRVSASSPVTGFLTNGALKGQTSEYTAASADYIGTATESFSLGCTWIGGTVKASLEAGTYNPPLFWLNSGTGPLGATIALPVNTLPIVTDLPDPLLCGQTFGPQAVHTPPPM